MRARPTFIFFSAIRASEHAQSHGTPFDLLLLLNHAYLILRQAWIVVGRKKKRFGEMTHQFERAQEASRVIALVDVDRPDEPLEVQIEQVNQAVLSVAVPNTFVRFELRRRDRESPFEGSLGGRYFMFDPATLAAKKSVTLVKKNAMSKAK
jgi:hypothetical protein